MLIMTLKSVIMLIMTLIYKISDSSTVSDDTVIAQLIIVGIQLFCIQTQVSVGSLVELQFKLNFRYISPMLNVVRFLPDSAYYCVLL